GTRLAGAKIRNDKGQTMLTDIKQTGAYLMRDGTGRPASELWHPDPNVRKMIKLMCDFEVEQGAARARWAQRTNETPLDMLILTNTTLPISNDILPGSNEWKQSVTIGKWLLALGIVPV